MPFEWKQGRNPYRWNYFGILGVGPNVQRTQIVAQEKKLLQKIAHLNGKGEKLEVAGQAVDEHTVTSASARLQNADTLAQELLLAHPQPVRDDKRRKNLAEQLRTLAAPPLEAAPVPLHAPLALFWFVPAPGAEAAERPGFDELGLVAAGDPADLELDIIFDR